MRALLFACVLNLAAARNTRPPSVAFPRIDRPSASILTSGTSAEIKWNLQKFRLREKVDGYEELSKRKMGSGAWTLAANEATIGRVASSDLHEVQNVTTTSSQGHVISDGQFRLSLQAHGLNDFDPETKTTTSLIPFNATEDEVKAAVESLENVGTVNVVRSSLGYGRYTWSLTFPGKSQHREDRRNRGDIPMLQVVWQNLKGMVVVKEARRGEGVMCSQSCVHVVDGLEMSAAYSFRVRARVEGSGWGPYSGASDYVLTSRAGTLEPPAAPQLLSATHTSINVRVLLPSHFRRAQFQYRPSSAASWTNVPETSIHAAGGFAAASLQNLEQTSTYETRAIRREWRRWQVVSGEFSKNHTRPTPVQYPMPLSSIK